MTERRSTPKARARPFDEGKVTMERRLTIEEQILALLSDPAAAATIEELCNMHGISSAALAQWRSDQGGLAPLDVARLKRLEDENRRLRALVADLTLSNQALKSAVSKKKW